MSDAAPTKVLHVVRPAAGGLREHVIDLCARLAQHGRDVMVAGALPPDFRHRLTSAGVRWANVGFPHSLQLGPNRAAVRTFSRLFTSQQPDLVHAHGYHAALVCGLAAKRATPRPPFVFTAHTLPFGVRRPLLRRIGEWLAYRHAIARADRIITVSDAVGQALARISRRAAGKCVTVHNGIDASVFRASTDYDVEKEELGLHPSAVVVGVVARLSHEKGVDVFICAAELISEHVPNIEFLIVGDGPERERLQALAHTHHVLGNTVFTGARLDIPAVLSVVDVLAIPSRSEAFSLAALEGLSAGLPIVAARVGGIPEVLEGAPNAFLVPPEDARALAQQIMTVLSELPTDEEEAAGKPSDILIGPDGQPVRMLVSQRSYELTDEADWDREAAAGPETDTRPGLAYVEKHFGLDAMVRKTEAVYDGVLRAG